MKKIKGIVFSAGFVLCGFIAGSCVNAVEAGQKDVFEIKKSTMTTLDSIHIL